jgi:hypothetical protein
MKHILSINELYNGKDKPVIKLVKGDPTRCYIPLHYINNISINEIYEEG